MAVIIEAFTDGEMQTVNKGVKNLCFLTAFTTERIEEFRRRYSKNAIAVNGREVSTTGVS